MIKWIPLGKGIRYKEHPNRKHGIRPDRYFSVRYQVNGKSCESGLGWASEGWAKDKAVVERARLIEEAKAGHGVLTHRQVQIKKAAIFEEQEEKTKNEAEKKRKKTLTVKEFFDQIYYPQIQKEKKPKAYQREESLFRIWIDKNIGKLTFHKVIKEDIENIFYDMIDSGRSVRSAEYTLTTLKQIWREAKENGSAPDMPLISKLLKKKISSNNNKRVRFLSHDEAEKLLEGLKVRSMELYEKTLVSIHCGLRAGELHSLTWSQIDLEHGIFNVLDSKGKDRAVYMTSAVKDVFAEKVQGKPNELVFPASNGKISQQVSKVFKDVADYFFNQEITDRRQIVTFHTCRHTCASWMVMTGISLYVVQKVLGHSTIQVTERYAHLAPDQLQLAANAIDRVVSEHKEEKIIPFKRKV
ncbi:site-specific integrase [Patescibacteria group bacterium]|nr:site-specific integrase [Patescibacteria group bacterium]